MDCLLCVWSSRTNKTTCPSMDQEETTPQHHLPLISGRSLIPISDSTSNIWISGPPFGQDGVLLWFSSLPWPIYGIGVSSDSATLVLLQLCVCVCGLDGLDQGYCRNICNSANNAWIMMLALNLLVDSVVIIIIVWRTGSLCNVGMKKKLETRCPPLCISSEAAATKRGCSVSRVAKKTRTAGG